MTPSFLPGKRTMKLCISCGPAGVFMVKVSTSRLSFANCFLRKASALACPGLPTQRGPMETNWRVYSRARWQWKVWDVAERDAAIRNEKVRIPDIPPFLKKLRKDGAAGFVLVPGKAGPSLRSG